MLLKLELLDNFQASVIKGNAGELSALAESNEVCIPFTIFADSFQGLHKVSSKGVDTVGGFRDPVTFVRELAKKESERNSCLVICSHCMINFDPLLRMRCCVDRQGRLRLGR